MGLTDAIKSQVQIRTKQLEISKRQLEMEKKRLKLYEKSFELEKEMNLNEGVPYEIREGDNLTKISQATGISIHDLAKDNDIKNKNVINAGDTIFFKHHFEPWQKFNSEEMNEIESDMLGQEAYFLEVEMEAFERYHEVSKKGAQQYLKDQEK